MNKIKQDKYERVINNTVLDSDLAFIDETFKANSGILNSLLQIMNERQYRNGEALMDIPLISMIGASNELNDESDGLEALFDRFHLKFVVKPIKEPGNFMKMLENGNPQENAPKNIFTKADLDSARTEISEIKLDKNIIHKLTKLREELNHGGLFVTDRTYNSAIKVLKTEAWIHGHETIEEDDLDILRHMFWTDPDQMRTIYMKILEMTNPEKNIVLDKFEESMRLVRELFAEKDPVQANSMAIEYATKLKDAKKEINKLRSTMVSKNKNVDDVDKMLKEINEQIRNIMVDILQVDINME
jgi:MoxR-like ATPase